MNKKETSWGSVAGWYDEHLEGNDDSFQKNVIMPNLIRLLAPKKGMEVIDVACGQGYFTRAFYSHGATTVGCDISLELIGLARTNSIGKDGVYAGPEYFTGSSDIFTSRMPKPEQRFDAATIILALQNIENIVSTFAECAKALKPGGRVIFVINHPAFRIPKASGWQWDEAMGVQYRRLDAYMSDSQNKIDMTPGEQINHKKKFTVSFHRPLQAYFKALNKGGFAVTRLEEWISHKKSEKGPRSAEEDRIRKEIPMFLCVEAKKL